MNLVQKNVVIQRKPEKPFRHRRAVLTAIRFCKWAFSQIFIGVVVAAAVSLSAILVENANVYREENRQLQKVQIGVSKQYIDSILGPAMIQFTDPVEETDLVNAYYALEHATVRCVFAEDEAVAFFITMKKGKPFFQPHQEYSMGFVHKKLGSYTYSDLTITNQIEGNVPANNIAYLYYSESCYGGGPADYCYFVYASYMDEGFSDGENTLPLFGQAYAIGDPYFKENADVYNALRERIKPNTFGMIRQDYFRMIDVIPSSENLRNYCRALFF